MACGSLMEVETQLLASERLRYLDEEVVEQILLRSAELGKVLNGLISSLP
jgi:four helix bundle protein